MLNELFHKITNSRWRIALSSANAHRYYYYENLLIKYKSLLPYKSLYLKANRLNKITTNEEICHSLILKLGSSIKHVQKQLSYTKYYFSNKSQSIKREVLLYRFKMAGQKVKLEMHFYKGTLFFYKYTFSYITENDKQELIGLIINKYNVDELNFEHDTIIDENNNCILINDHQELSISYVSLNHPFFTVVFQDVPQRKNIFESSDSVIPI